jgi:hypothetical protein
VKTVSMSIWARFGVKHTSVLDCKESMSSCENRTGDSLPRLVGQSRNAIGNELPGPDLRLRRRGRFGRAGSHFGGCGELQWLIVCFRSPSSAFLRLVISKLGTLCQIHVTSDCGRNVSLSLVSVAVEGQGFSHSNQFTPLDLPHQPLPVSKTPPVRFVNLHRAKRLALNALSSSFTQLQPFLFCLLIWPSAHEHPLQRPESKPERITSEAKTSQDLWSRDLVAPCAWQR